jgi:hypothetical protein
MLVLLGIAVMVIAAIQRRRDGGTNHAHACQPGPQSRDALSQARDDLCR